MALNIGGRYETEIGTLQWHPAMAPRPLPQSPPFPHHSTLQWHPTMAPNNGTTSIPPKLKLVVTLPLQPWHTTMAPCNGTTSTPPKLTVTLPNDSTLQWHRTMAPSNGTTSTPPKLVVTFPLQPWHTTMAPCNGTTSTPPCNGTLVPRPICQNGSSPSRLLEVRTPIAIAIWEKTWKTEQNARHSHPISPKSWIWWTGEFQPDATQATSRGKVWVQDLHRVLSPWCCLYLRIKSEFGATKLRFWMTIIDCNHQSIYI